MNKFFWILVFGLCTLYISAQTDKASKYFEGIIEYEIKNESFMQGVSDNELRERMGAVMKLYFKNGSYIREYLDGAGYTLRKMFYLRDKNIIYDYYPVSSPDTIYFMSAADEVYKNYKIELGISEAILNCECPSVVIKAKYVSDFLPDTSNTTMTYYFCQQLPVDPEWHKEMYVWKDVIKHYKSIAVKLIEEMPSFMKQIFTATKILWQNIPEDVFKIDPKLVLKKASDH